MNLFESDSLQQLLFSAFITTFLVIAIAVTFDKYFNETERIRTKLLVFVTAMLITLITVEFDFSNWQKLATRIFITMAFAVLFYHYIGGRFVKMLFVKIKAMLPGNDKDEIGNS